MIRNTKGFENIKIEGIGTNDVRNIYQAKCNDLNIPVLFDQEMRFVVVCEKSFKNRTLDLGDNGIGPLTAQLLGSIIKHNQNYSRLLLGKNALGDRGVKLLGNALLKNSSIVHVDISSNDINSDGAKYFLKSLINHPSIVSINMSSSEGLRRNRVGPTGAVPLKSLLQKNLSLSFLNLSRTALGPEGCNYIIDGLLNNKSLLSLDISNNSFNPKNIESLCSSIVTSKLIELNLSGNNLGASGCDYLQTMLCGGLGIACFIRKLDISFNEINCKGVAKLASGLKNNSGIKILNLEGNPLCGQSSTSLHVLIATNIAIEELNLNACQLGDEGVGKLNDALESNKTLKSLLLSNNQIDDEGAEIIAQGIVKNYALKYLDLGDNRIRRKGGISLANALRMNMTLKNINLTQNNIKDDAGQLFSELSRNKSNILRLGLDLNPISYKYLQDIQTNVKKNRKIYKQAIAPKLKEDIEKLKLSDSLLEKIQEGIEKKQKEKEEMNFGLEKTTRRLTQVGDEENMKYENLKKKFDDAKGESLKLSLELENFHFEVNSVKRKGDKEMQDYADMISYVVADMKKFERQSK